jgi:sulfite reductase (NADPH) flavoprotein alpha-component
MPGPYTRANPFPAKVAVNRSLCGEGSDKDTRHFELDLKGWGLNYDVGDSMTVWPTNDPALVDELINKIGAKGDETVKGPNGEKALREVLFRDCRITQTTPKFLKAIAERAVNGAPLLTELLKPERKQDLDTYLWGMEVVDFLIEHPSIKWRPQELVDTLAKLLPRMYSISSSLKAHPDQVHFTIDVVHYESRGRERKGVCSTFLAERAEKASVPVFPKRIQVSVTGRWEHANHHGWPGHRGCAVSCVFAGTKSNRRERKELAFLRIAAQTLQLFLRG